MTILNTLRSWLFISVTNMGTKGGAVVSTILRAVYRGGDE
jgi:hypothetical protein